MRNIFMPTTTPSESTAMTARKNPRPAPHRAAPPHPDYNDEISHERMDIIRRLADPDGKRAAKRVIMYPSLV